MRILIVGGGGREHALAWKVAQSPRVAQIWVAPGNAGTAQENKVTNLPIAAHDIAELKAFALKQKVDLCIVGPEIALSLGISDQFSDAGIACFGPSQAAAQLESSKVFSKEFMQKHHIPTAAFASFTNAEKARQYILTQAMPIVIKADGLAQGKGVVIAQTQEAALATIDSMLQDHAFGSASDAIVIEEFLAGEELSFIVIVDGQHIQALASSQDHKRRDNQDLGPNTGGMGAYSPSPLLDAALEHKILHQIIEPTVAALAGRGMPYKGFLYAGLMIDSQGNPRVLEYNCRLGDPETQPILMRLKTDLIDLCLRALEGQLDKCEIEWDPRPALGVVMCSGGYPGSYFSGYRIEGLAKAALLNNVKVFHAGTKAEGDEILSQGGRVLCVTALGNDIKDAQKTAYQACQLISWSDSFYRSDIGYRAIAKLPQ